MREELGEKSANKGTTKRELISSTLSLMREGGFATYKNAITIANKMSKMVLGRGLTVVGGSILSRGLRFLTSPIGWSIVGTWTVLYLSKPAYRATVPCVIHIAYMRAKQEYLRAQNSV